VKRGLEEEKHSKNHLIPDYEGEPDYESEPGRDSDDLNDNHPEYIVVHPTDHSSVSTVDDLDSISDSYRSIGFGTFGNEQRANKYLKNTQISTFVFMLGIFKQFFDTIVSCVKNGKLKMEDFVISFSENYSITESLYDWKTKFLRTTGRLEGYLPQALYRKGKKVFNKAITEFSNSFNEGLRTAGEVAGQSIAIGVLNVAKAHEETLQEALASMHEEILHLSSESGKRGGAGLLEGVYLHILPFGKYILFLSTPLLVVIAFIKFAQRVFLEKDQVNILSFNNF
jgi:hypothetical protein